MNRSVLINEVSYEELERALARSVHASNKELVRLMQQVSQEVMATRRVLSLSEACAFFDHKVNEATLRKYIKNEGLPANKVGRQYFVDREELMDWQMGRVHSARQGSEEEGDPAQGHHITEPWARAGFLVQTAHCAA